MRPVACGCAADDAGARCAVCGAVAPPASDGRTCMQLLSIVKQLSKACEFRRVFFTCAATTAAVAPLREHLAAAARPAAWEFEPAAPTEMTWPQLAAELVREKLYWSHNHEVPYRLRPVCRRFSLAPDGNAVVLVVRPSPRDIMLPHDRAVSLPYVHRGHDWEDFIRRTRMPCSLGSGVW